MQQLMVQLLVRKLLTVAAIVYTLLLGVLSLIKVPDLNPPEINHGDKWIHSTAYFLLMMFWGLYYLLGDNSLSAKAIKSKKNIHTTLVAIAVLATVYGVLLEFLQGALTTYRALDYYDALANIFGIILAVIVLIWIGKKKKL